MNRGCVPLLGICVSVITLAVPASAQGDRVTVTPRTSKPSRCPVCKQPVVDLAGHVCRRGPIGDTKGQFSQKVLFEKLVTPDKLLVSTKSEKVFVSIDPSLQVRLNGAKAEQSVFSPGDKLRLTFTKARDGAKLTQIDGWTAKGK
jgi:hypothetical protein